MQRVIAPFPCRMASFGWKRKVGEKVSKSVVQQFEAEAEKAKDVGPSLQDEEVDWLHASKRRREVLLDDCASKSKRLKDEGAQLAEQGRWGMSGFFACCVHIMPGTSLKRNSHTFKHPLFGQLCIIFLRLLAHRGTNSFYIELLAALWVAGLVRILRKMQCTVKSQALDICSPVALLKTTGAEQTSFI